MIFFWAIGTVAGGISTPRSPLATMTPSVTRMIASRFSNASGRSSLAIIGILARSGFMARMASRTISISFAERTKEIATASTPWSSPKAKSSRSLAVKPGMARSDPGKFTPLCELSGPPSKTLAWIRSSSTAITFNSRCPSSSSTWLPA